MVEDIHLAFQTLDHLTYMYIQLNSENKPNMKFKGYTGLTFELYNIFLRIFSERRQMTRRWSLHNFMKIA